MKLINKEASETPVSITESIFQSTDNDAHALILTSIISDIIQATKFSCDTNDEIYALMFYCGTPDRFDIESMEFVVAINLIGLLKGVALNAHDIEIILENLKYYAAVSGDHTDLTDENDETVEVCQ